MPMASFDLSSSNTSTANPAMPIGVFRYTTGTIQPFAFLPNIFPIRIDYHEGPDPPVARFKYILDDNLGLNLGWPSRVQQIWPLTAPPSPYVVQQDDRIVVLTFNPDGSPLYLFDGFAQIPQADITPQSEGVTFVAVGVAARAWDIPISGCYQRDGSNPQGGGVWSTDLPPRFNPSDTSVADGNKGGIVPNCTPIGFRVNYAPGSGPGATTQADFVPENDPNSSFAIFLDPGIESSPDPRSYWTVSAAIRYLLSYANDETYVVNPSFGPLDLFLLAWYPIAPTGPFDPTNPVNFATADVIIRDYDASNKPWPEAVAELLDYAGFGFYFLTGADSKGLPFTTFDIYRKDAANPIAPKQIYLDRVGATLNLANNNVTAFHLSRDTNQIVNAWAVETPLKQYEISIILAPGYQPSTADAMAANRNQFLASRWGTNVSTSIRRKYRWYIADELGSGYWDIRGLNFVVGTAFDFTFAFQDPTLGILSGQYVQRLRPGSKALISLDSAGHPINADLSISYNYQSPAPGLWDGTGTWQSISGGWQLLDDRLGIKVTVEDPEQWNGGKGCGDIRGISWWADPPNVSPINGTSPVLRLTTVIEADFQMDIAAPPRIATPTKFARFRLADAGDHFQKNTITLTSMYNPTGNNIVARDDSNAALAHARQLRSSSEFPPLAGSATIPFITTYYGIGDRISVVSGRNISLQSNVGISAGEAPNYPSIVAVSWQFDTGQYTTLQLADVRAQKRNL